PNAESLAAAVHQVIDDRALAVSLGEHAMSELYLSWEDSVTRAYERYNTVIDRYWTDRKERRGKSDTFFKTIAKLYKQS
ncbi:MAG: hypothetical protein IJ240_01045, partial [Clostridia bacterium]|nr:hypothetical protein [Clostridia bacterium]